MHKVASETGGCYQLTSGRVFYSVLGSVGIDERGSLVFDPPLDLSLEPLQNPYTEDDWTLEERAELAFVMIARWRRWAAVGYWGLAAEESQAQ